MLYDFLGTEDAKENESVLDYKTKTLYERLILSQHVLKCTATEAIEIVSGLDEVKDLNSQNDRLFLDDIRGKEFVDKIIVKYINRKNKRIMYWSPCNIIDFFNVSGSWFVNQFTDKSMRSSAQGLFMLMTNGIGATIGTLAAQNIVNYYTENVDGMMIGDWSSAWYIFAAYSLVIAILFAIFFKYDFKPAQQKNA